MKMLITFPFEIKQTDAKTVEVSVRPINIPVLSNQACEYLDKTVSNAAAEDIYEKMNEEYQRLIIINQIAVRVLHPNEPMAS